MTCVTVVSAVCALSMATAAAADFTPGAQGSVADWHAPGMGPCLDPQVRGWAWARRPDALARSLEKLMTQALIPGLAPGRGANEASSGPAAQADKIWVLQAQSAPGRDSALTWHRDAAPCCIRQRAMLTKQGDAGVHIDLAALLHDWREGAGGAYWRQTIFRLGLGNVGQAEGTLTVIPPSTLTSYTTVQWPGPPRGPAAAFGPPQPVGRPPAVPATAPAYVAAVVSPGRTWQEMETYAGGLWPLETTLVGTQIAGWEQTHGRRVVEDLLGLQAQVWSLFVPPKGPAHRPVVAMPVANPEGVLDFLRWVVDVVSAFAPKLKAQTLQVDGQPVWRVRGLLGTAGLAAEDLYLTLTDGAVLLCTDLGVLRRSAQLRRNAKTRVPHKPSDASGATASAVMFGAVQHDWLNAQRRLVTQSRRASWLAYADVMLMPGVTQVDVQTTPSGWECRTQSSFTPRQASAYQLMKKAKPQ